MRFFYFFPHKFLTFWSKTQSYWILFSIFIFKKLLGKQIQTKLNAFPYWLFLGRKLNWIEFYSPVLVILDNNFFLPTVLLYLLFYFSSLIRQILGKKEYTLLTKLANWCQILKLFTKILAIYVSKYAPKKIYDTCRGLMKTRNPGTCCTIRKDTVRAISWHIVVETRGPRGSGPAGWTWHHGTAGGPGVYWTTSVAGSCSTAWGPRV